MRQIFSNKNYRGFYESYGYIDAGSTLSDLPLFIGYANGPVVHKDVTHYMHATAHEIQSLFLGEDIKKKDRVYRGIKRGKISFWDYPIKGLHANNIVELFFEIFMQADPEDLSELSKYYYESYSNMKHKVTFTSIGNILFAKHNNNRITYICEGIPVGRWDIDPIAASYVFHNRKPFNDGGPKIETDIQLAGSDLKDVPTVHVVPVSSQTVSEVPMAQIDAHSQISQQKRDERVDDPKPKIKPKQQIKSKTKSKNDEFPNRENTRVRVKRTFSSRE